jgi:hypothetical protein
MAKVYTATISYTIYPDEFGLLESDYEMLDEDELAESHRTPDELMALVKEEFYEMLTDGTMRFWDWIDVEVEGA